MTLYADYINEYTITYHLDGGTNSTSNPATYVEGNGGLTTPLADASKSGYVFRGWYTDASFTNQFTVITPDTAGNLDLYAKYIEIYTITYVLNGGTMADPVSQTYTSEDAAIVYPVPSKANAIFEGWYKSADFSGSPVASQPKGTAGNITLYAKWKSIYRIYVYYNTFGTVSCNGSVIPNRSYFEVEEGDSLTMYFNPLSTSYYPYNCTVNNVKKGSISSLTLENIRDNQVVSVTFAPTFARPMTGDSSRLLLWAGLMAFSGVAAGVLLGRKKKKQQ